MKRLYLANIAFKQQIYDAPHTKNKNRNDSHLRLESARSTIFTNLYIHKNNAIFDNKTTDTR